MNVIDLASLLKTAETTARQAGKFIREKSHETIVINEAHQHDLKIQLDVESQHMIEQALSKAFPDHAILGEEGGEGSGGKGFEWIVDPIDGTVNLTYGIPHFCVSIACRLDNEVVLGVVYDPNRDECFTASKDQGAFLNGKRISVSKRTDLKEAILALGFSKDKDSVQKCLELYQHYGPRVRKLRAMGSAALDMSYIASGRLDGYIEQGIKIWDIAAGLILIQEAGGKVDLTPQTQSHHYHVCAWNGKLHLAQR